MKHFPTYETKLCPDAVVHRGARVLAYSCLSGRRWTNSPVHNLCELVILPGFIGFCCFSIRFFIFIDLLGTLVRPFPYDLRRG